MRRLIIEEPVTRPAVWSPRIAWFALAVTAIALALVRFELAEFTAGAVALGLGLALALVAVLCAAAAYLRIWTEGRRGLGKAVWGMILGVAILAYPGYFAARGLLLPRMNDISTDTENPPAFSRSRAALEARGGRVPPEVDPAVRRLQRPAYPQVAPLTLDLAPEEAFEIARKAAERRGWRIVESVPPGGRIGLGRIEAVDRTFLLRLPDDVTVRLRPRADGTRIDVRSASRLGRHDLGANAARIRRYLDEVSGLALTVK
jgi:uncharacterized protein (DUF1499 family)